MKASNTSAIGKIGLPVFNKHRADSKGSILISKTEDADYFFCESGNFSVELILLKVF